jgi:hypothetical protein
VAVELFRPQSHEFGATVEMIGLLGILREMFDEIEGDAQQVAHGVFMLGIRQSPGHDTGCNTPRRTV